MPWQTRATELAGERLPTWCGPLSMQAAFEKVTERGHALSFDTEYTNRKTQVLCPSKSSDNFSRESPGWLYHSEERRRLTALWTHPAGTPHSALSSAFSILSFC